jgi:hypothetical protein
MKILYLHDLNKETNSALFDILRDQFELITPTIGGDNYNDFPVNHPLSGFRHCWLFHQLYTVAKVSFADLLRAGYMEATISVDALSSPLIVDSVKA